jgi:hypothetical protein
MFLRESVTEFTRQSKHSCGLAAFCRADHLVGHAKFVLTIREICVAGARIQPTQPIRLSDAIVT